LPSIWTDLYPTVILEAFTLEKRVVAFDYGGAKEIIESSGGGLLATPFDVGSLVKCLRHLLENPISRKQNGQLAGKWARETVHPNVVIDKFIAIYEHLTS
jgi:glycosyltransferase involved in cell wall biosynthesis